MAAGKCVMCGVSNISGSSKLCTRCASSSSNWVNHDRIMEIPLMERLAAKSICEHGKAKESCSKCNKNNNDFIYPKV